MGDRRYAPWLPGGLGIALLAIVCWWPEPRDVSSSKVRKGMDRLPPSIDSSGHDGAMAGKGSGPAGSSRVEGAPPPSTTENDTICEIVRHLEALHGQAGPLGEAGVSELIRRMSGLFAGNDGSVEEAAALLLSGEIPYPVASLITRALGSTGTNSCQTVLLEISQRESLEGGLRQEALSALTRTPDPNSRTIEQVREMALKNPDDSLRDRAMRGLGLIASSLSGDRARSAEMLRLLQALEPDVPPGLTGSYLNALGYASLRETVEIVSRFAKHESAEVRAEAVLALRHVEGKDVDALLIESIRGDSSEQVRIKAVQALWARDSEATRSGMRSACEDPSEEVRRMAVGWMGSHVSFDPPARELLQSIARSDPSERVRLGALAALRAGAHW